MGGSASVSGPNQRAAHSGFGLSSPPASVPPRSRSRPPGARCGRRIARTAPPWLPCSPSRRARPGLATDHRPSPSAQNMDRGERTGPCGNPTCSAPETCTPGQWTFIPSDFTGAVARNATCHCKKRPCRRYFGRLEEKQTPGRKPSQPLHAPEASQQDSDCLPPPFKLAKIEQLWGHRCQPPSSCTRAPPPERSADRVRRFWVWRAAG